LCSAGEATCYGGWLVGFGFIEPVVLVEPGGCVLDVLLCAAQPGDVSAIGCGGGVELLFSCAAFLRFFPGFERGGFSSVGGVDFPEVFEGWGVFAERSLFGFCRFGGGLCLGQLEELIMSVIFPWFSSLVLFYC
jgi:hypothetical protein